MIWSAKMKFKITSLFSLLAVGACLLLVQPNSVQAQANYAGQIGATGTPLNTVIIARATLAAGTVTITNTNVVAASDIYVYRQVVGGTVGFTYPITARSTGSFTITAKAADGTTTAAGDTSILSYHIFNY